MPAHAIAPYALFIIASFLLCCISPNHLQNVPPTRHLACEEERKQEAITLVEHGASFTLQNKVNFSCLYSGTSL